jgi:hypothetical protein
MGRSQRPNLGATSARAETRRAKRSAEPTPPALAIAASTPSNGDRGSGRRGTEVRAVVAPAERAASVVGVAAPSSVVTSSVAGEGDVRSVRVGFEPTDEASRLVGSEAGTGGRAAVAVLAVPPASGARPSIVVASGALVPAVVVLGPATAVLAADVIVGTTVGVAVVSVAVVVLTASGTTSVVSLTTACTVCTVCAASPTTDSAVSLTTDVAACVTVGTTFAVALVSVAVVVLTASGTTPVVSLTTACPV